MCDMDGGYDGDLGSDMDVSSDGTSDMDGSTEADGMTETEGNSLDSLEDINAQMDDTPDINGYDLQGEGVNMQEGMDENTNSAIDNLTNMESAEFNEDDETGEDSGEKSLGEYPNMREIWESSTEEILDNYRENLENRDVPEEKINEFLAHEREAMELEYDSARRGETSENIYYMPENWDEVAEDITSTSEASQAEYRELDELGSVDGDYENISTDMENNNEDMSEEVDTTDLSADIEDVVKDDYYEDGLVEEMDETTEEAQETTEDIQGYTEEVQDYIEEAQEYTEEAQENIEENRETEENVQEYIEEVQENIEENQETEEDVQEYIEETQEHTDEAQEIEPTLDEVDEAVDELIETEDINDIEDSLEVNEEDITDAEEEIDEQIDYDEIYQQIDREVLEQGFENIDIEEDAEQLDSVLVNFEADAWENLSLDEQKESMSNLAEYVSDTIGFENPPQIEYYNNPEYGEYGSYNPYTNTLSVNEYMLEDSKEAADTIAHELWHAHQHECAENPRSPKDYQYRYNFENYISPEYGQTDYENQLVEAEARAFANQFKDRLAGLGGRKR